MARKQFLINQAQAGYLLGVDSRTIQTWGKRTTDPLPVANKGKRGTPNQYDPPELVQWYVQNELNKLNIDDGELLSLEAERAKLTRLQAKKVELDLAEREGKLYPSDVLVGFFTKVLLNTRSRLLALPTKAAPTVHGCQSIAATAEEIRKHVYDALTELSTAKIEDLLKDDTSA